MSKILLIEDEQELRELVEYNLTGSGHIVTEAENANDALQLLQTTTFDIILLDLMLPGLQGMQFLEIIRKNNALATTPVIIVSAKNSEQDIIRALSAGADDFITKPFTFDYLEAKIQATLRRGGKEVDTKGNRYGITIDEQRYKVYSGGEEIKVTQKELELLKLFLKHPGRIFSRDQLLNSVWGYSTESMSRTVDSHVATLRKKLGDKGHIIRSVPKIGYGLE